MHHVTDAGEHEADKEAKGHCIHEEQARRELASMP